MVTKGHRKIGRRIRKLGNSVELSSKESEAKESERKYREKVSPQSEDSPIQKIRDPLIYEKDYK